MMATIARAKPALATPRPAPPAQRLTGSVSRVSGSSPGATVWAEVREFTPRPSGAGSDSGMARKSASRRAISGSGSASRSRRTALACDRLYSAKCAVALQPPRARVAVLGWAGLDGRGRGVPHPGWFAVDGRVSQAQLLGAQTFLSIRCSLCHNGPALSDNLFHNVAVAQFGPGQGDGPSTHDDFGRMRVTGDPADQYRFRTTPLRNVEFTGPYGHDGAFFKLREFVEHYSESHLKLRSFDPLSLELLLQATLLDNADAILATRDVILDGVVLPSEVVDQLTAFMGALTDPRA